jgi:hypothetical protein
VAVTKAHANKDFKHPKASRGVPSSESHAGVIHAAVIHEKKDMFLASSF